MNYHNPEQITEWGQSDGWRLLTTEEIKQPLPDDAEIRCADGRWAASGCRGAEGAGEVCTYRTRKPLPVSPLIAKLDAEIKAKQELREIVLAVEAGAEWEVKCDEGDDWHNGGYPFDWYLSNERTSNWQVRLKPKPVTRDWSKPEDVPGPVCWLRGASGFGVNAVERLVFIVTTTGLEVFRATTITWDQIYKWEHSTDRINWFKCETTEEAK